METVTRRHHRRVICALIASFFVILAVFVFVATKFGYWQFDGNFRGPSSAEYEASDSAFVGGEEGVVVTLAGSEEVVVLPVEKVLFAYVEVTDSCGAYWSGSECVNVRSGPGTDFPSVGRLRNHVILKVAGKVERDGAAWFKIIFDETLRYPERVTGDWYVHEAYVDVLFDEGTEHLTGTTRDTAKHILVDKSEQRLYAYYGGNLIFVFPVSTGHELTPTPEGVHTVYKKMPSRYMQGPIEGVTEDHYDLPGVPWNLYFYDGAVIHGAYWHENFGTPYSHGCVNLLPSDAKQLYDWADLGTLVRVQE